MRGFAGTLLVSAGVILFIFSFRPKNSNADKGPWMYAAGLSLIAAGLLVLA